MSDQAMGPAFKKTEVGLIPMDWDWVHIIDVATVRSGGTPNRTVPQYWNGDIPWITTGQIDFNVITEASEFITESGSKNSAAKLFPAGTILMALYGQGKTRGKVAVLGIEAATNQACAAIYIHDPVLRRFAFLYLTSRYEELRSLSNSGNQENLSCALIKTVRITFPPASEQEAIAEALGDADALIDALERLVAKKRDLKLGAMQELLTGKRRLPEFGAGKKTKRTEIGSIPEDWKLESLKGSLRRAPKYGINAAASPFSFLLPTYLRITDITGDGRFLEAAKTSVDHPASASYLLEPGDIVFARTGASVGKSYLYNPDDGPLVFAGFLIRLSPDPQRLSSKYLFYFAQSFAYWNWVRVNSMRSGQPGINGKEYAAMPIALPSTFAEQSAIANILSDMDAEIAILERKLQKARDLKLGMMQELLTGRTRLI